MRYEEWEIAALAQERGLDLVAVGGPKTIDNDVTDDFVRYARPLIGDNWPTIPLVDGRQRFARLERIFAPQKLPGYVPQAHRRG